MNKDIGTFVGFILFVGGIFWLDCLWPPLFLIEAIVVGFFIVTYYQR